MTMMIWPILTMLTRSDDMDDDLDEEDDDVDEEDDEIYWKVNI